MKELYKYYNYKVLALKKWYKNIKKMNQYKVLLMQS